jgi:hypothetical protein
VRFRFAKSTEDKIMDILLDIPGLVESIKTSKHTGQHQSITKLICDIRMKLAHWWVEWYGLNPKSASETVRHYESNNLAPFIADFLSTNLHFDTAQQGLELICYHSAMLLLSQVERVLWGYSPDDHEILSMRRYGEKHEVISKRQDQTPLLLPEEIEHDWLHGLEGLRILSGFRASLEARSELYLTFGPLAILYGFARNLGIAQTMLGVISSEDWAEDAETELGRYDFYKLGLSAQIKDSTVAATVDHSQRRTAKASVSVGGQLFINSSWP